MKLQPLYDLQQEINRLFIAGSKFAKADPRLSKQIPVFTKLGEKVPVFKKIATDLEDLVQTDAQQSAEKLMSISTLLYSVLYTQGEQVEEQVTEAPIVPAYDINAITTEHSYLQLKPVIEALSTSNQGRLEILKDAMERNIFSDFRTYAYLDAGLADKYAELSDYIITTIIPAVGPAILPFIEKSFAYEDKTEQVRRLRAFDLLGYKKLPAIIEKVLAESLPTLQAEAIRILSKEPANESLILKLADDKNKLVREAAYLALAGFNTKESLGKLKDVYVKGKNVQGLVNAISTTTLPYYFDEIFEQYTQHFKQFCSLTKDSPDKELVAAFGKLEEDVSLFRNKDRKEVYDLMQQLMVHQPFIDLLKAKKTLFSYSVNNFIHAIINVLHSLDAAKSLQFYANIIPQVKNSDWLEALYSQYYYAAINAGQLKEQLYTTFIEPYIKGYIPVRDLYNAVFPRNNYENTGTAVNLGILDKPWIKYLFQQVNKVQKWDYDLRSLVFILNAYEAQGSKEFNQLLTQLIQKFNLNEIDFVYELLLQRNVPGAFELIYHSLASFKSKSSYYYSYIGKQEYWKKFPKEYGPKIRALHEKEKLNLFIEIADTIEYQ